ncbi:hypothetical protein F4861DRAFT_64964 [Xylaria intraflava]|nr:hypothetical protein F4861DRAFT_64964 [Xylaria intraflava]
MPTYYHSDHHHKEGYELAQNLSRDLRHSHRPTKYIINEGKLILDEQALDDHHQSHHNKSNTIIYNSPGSTMWVQPSHRSRLEAEAHSIACRGCFRHRDRYYGGYCSDCLAAQLRYPRRHESSLVYPERRTIGWR